MSYETHLTSDCLLLTGVLEFGLFTVPDQQFENHETDAQGDRRICDIEGRPMIGKKMKIEKIHNLSILKTVNEISNGTTQNERERKRKYLLILPQSDKEKEDASYGNQGEPDKEQGSESSFFPAKDSESPPGVSHMNKIEESLDDFHPVMESHTLLDGMFGPLI